MLTKELIIAVVDNGNELLMRKKPAGSFPYTEMWYLFGCEHVPRQNDERTMKEYLNKEIGIEVDVDSRSIPSAQETKPDHDGVTKLFTYTNLLCHYVSGIPQIPKGAEKIEWLLIEKLAEYDLVPPSVKLLREMGYMH
jgi:hypothetical protein